MAWQSPSMGNGGHAGGDGSSAPVGTEYTLQGVMRFLQLEWHNHERARNAWDIERAEMKAKIAKLEGEARKSKQLNQQLERQIRMLETVLRNERLKNQGGGTSDKGLPVEDKKDSKGKSILKPDLKNAHAKQKNSFLDIDPEAPEFESDKHSDSQRDKSKVYLTRCVEEITYLLTPPAHPPAHAGAQGLANSTGFLGDTSLEEAYLQQRLRNQQQQLGAPNHVPYQNHQPLSGPSPSDMANMAHQQQAAYMTRESSHQPQYTLGTSQPNPDVSAQPQATTFSIIPEEQVEQVSHSYDSYGRPIAPPEEGVIKTGQIVTDESDGWTFDDTPSTQEQSQEVQPSRRPDTDVFPSASTIPAKSPPRLGSQVHRRKSSGPTAMTRRRSEGHETREESSQANKSDANNFKVRFALRGHMDVVRSVIFTGGGTPAEPEICTASDDGMIKRWIIPASYSSQHNSPNDLDIQSYFTHRGHDDAVLSLAACPASANFSTGGRVSGDGWIFSGGQDSTVRVWERGRVDPKATLEGHTDAVWTVCVLPATCLSVFGQDCTSYGGPDRILLASGSADGTVKIWAVSAPPQIVSPQTGSRRGVGGSRRHSVTSGSNFPSSPQPSVATTTPFHYMLIHNIERIGTPSPTCISPLSITGDNFVVSYNDASVIIFDARTGEEISGMDNRDTSTGVNTVAATTVGLEGPTGLELGRGISDDETVVGATGSSSAGGIEGTVISGHEDRYIRFFDANSGQCVYSMLAHPAAISSISLGKDGREIVSGGHDASIRFWSLEKRICTQEITSHRIMRGEGVCSVAWSQDGRLVVSAGGDGVVKVFSR